MAEYKQNLLNEKLKEREAEELKNRRDESGDDKPLALDDSQRIKVLSPARLVAKRFLKNKLAITGSVILIFMFVMCFIGAAIYPYDQTEKFNKIDALELEYAVSSELYSYTKYFANAPENDPVLDDLKLRIDSEVMTMEVKKEISKTFLRGNNEILLEKVADRVYKAVVTGELKPFGTYDPISQSLSSDESVSEEFLDALKAASSAKQTSFEFDGVDYYLNVKSKTNTEVSKMNEVEGKKKTILATKLVFDAVDHTAAISSDFKVKALERLGDLLPFTYEGKDYLFDPEDRENLLLKTVDGEPYAYISRYSTRLASGQDSLDLSFKMKVASIVDDMEDNNLKEYSFKYDVPQLNPETGKYDVDDDGNIKLQNETVNVIRKETAGERRYYFTYMMNRYLISIYEGPSAQHILGTDGDGYDVFSRILYGGRVSLLVGFVVVILETILGVIMGGIAGFFGGWVDTLIMRLVDIFYCIPTMPIMIIVASIFDYYKLHPYVRLLWMMVILGILGWSGIARLVRGQILSLREQEFMIAAEATGLRTSKRIFKHLIPNVMPQLIVSMTMGLGGVILTESSLSFLGLGVKHPLATWGNIINSVSTIEAMKEYTYIWIPVGILICLTVIAFNFVGDGLRDAFDPKMKR